MSSCSDARKRFRPWRGAFQAWAGPRAARIACAASGQITAAGCAAVQAFFSWMSGRCVSRSAVGWSLAASALSKAARAVLATASLPATRKRIMSCASGTVLGSSIELSLAYSRVRAGRVVAQGADALGDAVQRRPHLGVLRHEHVVQRVEHRARHVPVEVVRGSGRACRCRPAAWTARPATAARSLASMPMLMRGAAALAFGGLCHVEPLVA